MVTWQQWIARAQLSVQIELANKLVNCVIAILVAIAIKLVYQAAAVS